MKKITTLDENVIEWVHFDLTHWDSSQSLEQDIPTDTFSPNTLAYLKKMLASDRHAQALIAKAQTPEWSSEVAEELFAVLKAWLAKQGLVETTRRTNSHRH